MKVKHINLEYELEGRGIVNFDSNDQRHIWNLEKKNGDNSKFVSFDNNNKYAKKEYFRDNDGVLRYRIKISGDCLRNSIFRGDAVAVNPNIVHSKNLLSSFVGSSLGLIRGYLFAQKTQTIKRKSPLCITSAIQINNAESFMDFGSKSGDKTKEDSDEKSGLSVRNTEDIGNIRYYGKGALDIASLEFMSFDPVHDRYAFNPDDYDTLKMFLSKNLPNFNAELGYYTLKTSTIDSPEYGIKLTEEQVVFLIKETLRRMIDINILRATSYARISALRIRFVENALNPGDWIEIKSEKDIDDLDFGLFEYYVQKDESEARAQRDIIEECARAVIEAENEERRIKDEEKVKKKAEAEKKKNSGK